MAMGGQLATEQRADLDAVQSGQRPERGRMDPEINEGDICSLNEVSADDIHTDTPFHAGHPVVILWLLENHQFIYKEMHLHHVVGRLFADLKQQVVDGKLRNKTCT